MMNKFNTPDGRTALYDVVAQAVRERASRIVGPEGRPQTREGIDRDEALREEQERYLWGRRPSR